MNKNKYMAILIGVTALCMIIGTLYHAMGMFRFNRRQEDTPVEITREWTDGNNEVKASAAEKTAVKEETEETKEASAKKETDETKETPAKEEAEEAGEDSAKEETGKEKRTASLKKITADIDLADLTFLPGEELHVDFLGDDRFEPEVTEKDGVLTITQHVDTKWFNIFKKENRKGIKITVTIPEGTELEELKTDLDLGDTELDHVKAENCTLDSDLGDIKCNDCEFTGIHILSSLGDVHVKNCVFEDADVRQDLGDVNISTQMDLSDADLSLATDLGEVSVNGKEQGRKLSISGNGEIRVVVENDMGDIDLDYAA